MAKSLRSKREKRLRAIRREIVEPIYEKKEAAKLTAQEAALAAPKLPVRGLFTTTSMDVTTDVSGTSAATNTDMDVEMTDGNKSARSLKPMGKKMKKKLKLAKRKGKGKNKIRKKHNV